jgi:hypothetical protein
VLKLIFFVIMRARLTPDTFIKVTCYATNPKYCY